MAIPTASPDDEVTSALWNQVANLLNGSAVTDQIGVSFTNLASASLWALTVRNQTAPGQAFRVQNVAGSTILSVVDAAVTVSTALAMGGTSQIAAYNGGGAAAPGYAFGSDLDSGLAREGADSVSLAVGGAAGLIVSSAKNIYAGGSPGALTSSANAPFLFITGASGAPTGTPTNRSTNSQYPVYIDTGTSVLYYNAGASWAPITAAATSIANTSDITINSDSDSSGAGDINLQTKGTTRIKLPVLATAGGVFDFGDAATPGSPAASFQRFYIKSDHIPYVKSSAGTEYDTRAVGAAANQVYNGSAGDTAAWTGSPTLSGTVTAGAIAVSGNGAITPAAVSGTPAQHALYRDNVVKGWAKVTLSAGTPSIAASFNVSGITDTGLGQITVTWDRDFASAAYAVEATVQVTATNLVTSVDGNTAPTAGATVINSLTLGGSLADPAAYHILAIGAQ